jgi:hypothetical protein
MRRIVGLLACVACALGISACFAGSAGVKTNIISAANPTAFHTASDTGVTTVGPAVFNAGCAAKLGSDDVLECKWFFRVRLASAANINSVVPPGADADPTQAFPVNAKGTGPTQTFATIESGTKLHLQPWTDYQTQGCGWVRLSSAPSTWKGPFCGGKDTNADGKVDLNTWSDPWATQNDPSGFNASRANGVIVHWAGTGQRQVDFGDCTLSSGYGVGISRIPQWVVAGRYKANLTTCDSAAQDVRVSESYKPGSGILGTAFYYFYTATGHIVTTAPNKPTISLNSYYASGDVNQNTEVVVHESGHIAGLAHRKGTIMNAVAFGQNTNADAPNLGTIGFLYNHDEPAAAAARAAKARKASPAAVRDPALRKLLAGGAGARLVTQTGRTETETLINRGNGVMQTVFTMYATEAGVARDVQRQNVDGAGP